MDVLGCLAKLKSNMGISLNVFESVQGGLVNVFYVQLRILIYLRSPASVFYIKIHVAKHLGTPPRHHPWIMWCQKAGSLAFSWFRDPLRDHKTWLEPVSGVTKIPQEGFGNFFDLKLTLYEFDDICEVYWHSLTWMHESMHRRKHGCMHGCMNA